MTDTRKQPSYLDEDGNAYIQFHSTALPPNLDLAESYMLEFIGRDVGEESSSHPNMFYTGWFCKPSQESDEYWAQVVHQDGSMSWINLFAEEESEEESEEEDSPADWYESTERLEANHWTIYRSSHRSRVNHHVVIVRIDTGWHPFEDRAYAVLFEDRGMMNFYEGSYDLTLEQALEERERRSKVDDPSWWSTLPPKFRNWDAVNCIGEERLKQAFTWGSATDKALVELLYAAYIEDCHSDYEFLTAFLLPVVKESKDGLKEFGHDWTTDRVWQELIRD